MKRRDLRERKRQIKMINENQCKISMENYDPPIRCAFDPFPSMINFISTFMISKQIDSAKRAFSPPINK